MIRFYQKSWMIHHHAANQNASRMAGVDVLDQISRFINESHSIFSVQMDYVFCYYRPDNKFPDRVFGGVARNTNDPKKCSLDAFAYLHYNKHSANDITLEEPWHLASIRPENLVELKNFYRNVSGGLMLEAMELIPDISDTDSLSHEYECSGFKRKKELLALKKNNELKAIVLLNTSDIGLNLSELTNGIHIFVIDPEGITNEVLNAVLKTLSINFEPDEFPVLLYPASFADNHSIPYEKVYYLWVLSTQHLDNYFIYLNRLFDKINSIKSPRKKIVFL